MSFPVPSSQPSTLNPYLMQGQTNKREIDAQDRLSKDEMSSDSALEAENGSSKSSNSQENQPQQKKLKIQSVAVNVFTPPTDSGSSSLTTSWNQYFRSQTGLSINESLSQHSSQELRMYLTDLLNYMRTRKLVGNVKNTVEEYIKSMQEESVGERLQTILNNFQEYVLDNPRTFEVTFICKKIDRCLFELNLQEWIANPEVRGNKKEAASRMRQAYTRFEAATRDEQASDRSLFRLNLNDLDLTDLPPCLNLLFYIRELTLRNNKFTQFPQTFDQMTRLESLDLSYNCIESLHPVIGNFKNLTTLNLYRNRLTQLPDPMQDLQCLRDLSLSCNLFETVPEVIGSIKSLQHLGLGSNLLKTLPASFVQLTHMKRLYLHDNMIESLPECIQALKGLEILSLNNNSDLRELPDFVLNLGLPYALIDGTIIDPIYAEYIPLNYKIRRMKAITAAFFTESMITLKRDAQSQTELLGVDQLSDSEKYDIEAFWHIMGKASGDENLRFEIAKILYTKLQMALHNPLSKKRFIEAIKTVLKLDHKMIIKIAAFEDPSHPFDYDSLLNQERIKARDQYFDTFNQALRPA